MFAKMLIDLIEIGFLSLRGELFLLSDLDVERVERELILFAEPVVEALQQPVVGRFDIIFASAYRRALGIVQIHRHRPALIRRKFTGREGVEEQEDEQAQRSCSQNDQENLLYHWNLFQIGVTPYGCQNRN